MTAWDSEKSAILNMIQHYGEGTFACVMDSYDYIHALEQLLPSIREEKLEKGGCIILRPDSGDPAEAVLLALKAADAVFGSSVNSKGYRVLTDCGVIQGDGMSDASISHVLQQVKEGGYSAENCAFGMGGGLLQKINRDTMSFATKLSHIVYADGHERDVVKMPQTDPDKCSLPGKLAVKRVDGLPTVFPVEEVTEEENLLHVMYDGRPKDNIQWERFSELKTRVKREWDVLSKNKNYDPISPPLRHKIERMTVELKRVNSVG